MKKLFCLCFCLLLFIQGNESILQIRRYHAKVVILGKIIEESDFFGRKVFKGKVINKGRERADFVQIEFTMFNKRGKVINKKSIFINGSRYVFGDSTVSTSSLKINETGTFKCYTGVKSDSIATYKFKIKWKDYKYD